MVFSNGTDLSERMRTASAGQRVSWAMLGGAVAGAVVSLVTLPSAAILVGWDVAVVIYLVWSGSRCGGWTPAPPAGWRITLHHALLSYLFGAVLLGLVINVVATLLK